MPYNFFEKLKKKKDEFVSKFGNDQNDQVKNEKKEEEYLPPSHQHDSPFWSNVGGMLSALKSQYQSGVNDHSGSVDAKSEEMQDESNRHSSDSGASWFISKMNNLLSSAKSSGGDKEEDEMSNAQMGSNQEMPVILDFEGQVETYRLAVTIEKNKFPEVVVTVHHSSAGRPATLEAMIDGTVGYVKDLELARFPPGRGVSYLLLHRFAVVAQEYGINCIKLLAAVNRQNIELTMRKGGNENYHGALAAVSIYEKMGWDVSDAENATSSFVTPTQLKQRASMAARAKGWRIST